MSIPLFILIYIFLIPAFGLADESLDLNGLLKKAEEARLYEDRYWEVLLHYKHTHKGIESLIDDPHFFLSPDGKINPKLELEATIRAFFKSGKNGDEHPRCRFIARYEWLMDKLNIDEVLFSEINCKEFSDMMNDTIQPRSVVLVFPASYMNNPASMFGHTLLRLDGVYQSKLLSYAANYAAVADDDLGFFYVFKGISGYYKGYFKVFPYYERVKEYNDIEQRDMWEYSLNFSEEEVMRMFKHLWELKDIYSYYYFFDENCSYNLLFLLEAARPSVRLTEKLRPWVIPVDTVRVVKESGIVENIEFRPSKATKIRYIASLLADDYQKMAFKIANQEIEPENIHSEETDKIKILDLSAEIIQYRYNNRELARAEYSRLFLAILRERSKLGRPEDSSYNISVPTPPEDGHLSNRFSLGLGIKDDIIFQELRLRPAYHSMADPDAGYLEGSQIVFADISLRYYTNGRIKLECFDLIDIVSLTPRSNFFKPLSWKVKTGFVQKMFQDNKEDLVYQLNPGFGFTYENEAIGLWYTLAEANLIIGGVYKNSYAAGIGMQIGTIKKITNYWRIDLLGETLFYGFRESFHENKISAVQSFRLNKNNSLAFSLLWGEISRIEQTEAKLNWNYYF